MIRRAEAILLKTQKLGETSKILALFTREQGKVKVVAKGARSTRSRFGGTLEPLNHLSVIYYEKENRDLQTLSQADLIHAFPGVRSSLEKWTIASACCEFVYRLDFSAETVPLAFRHLLAALEALEAADRRVRNVLRCFELQLLKLSGFSPNFAACLYCGGEPRGDRVTFNIPRGGFVGRECSANHADGFQLSVAALRGLRALATNPAGAVAGIRLGKTVAGEIDTFLNTYLGYHFEGMAELRSLGVLRELEGKLKQT
jgi:DNA repair protein RecO (recombination protein O)